MSIRANRGLDWASANIYIPTLKLSLHNPAVVLSIAFLLMMLTMGLQRSGIVKFNVFPKLDSPVIEASISFPDGTPSEVVDLATKKMEQTIYQIDKEYREKGIPIVQLVKRSVGFQQSQGGPASAMGDSNGSNIGMVTVELVDIAKRPIKSPTLIDRWREEFGEYPGAETMKFSSAAQGPGGTPIEFRLLAQPNQFARLEAAVEKCKNKLAQYDGVYDIADDSTPGKMEFRLKIKEKAKAMGVTLGELAETVRSTYYGEEVMRLQRGRHEVKMMVRYPRQDRQSLADFQQIRIRTNKGVEVPVTELADIKVQRNLTEINRVDQQRSIKISADVREDRANAREIIAELQKGFIPDLLEKNPGLSVRWEGQQQQTVESMQSLLVGYVIALLGMFVLLTLEFRSYLQPLLIMAIIPFGIIGAVLGHAFLNLEFTMFSIFGLVALTGVVVNDSIVLIDFINHRVREGIPLYEALVDAGQRRLRPILLTSITTVAGLLPIMLETSFQAQVIIPMATSLAFGLMMTTVLVLFLVPTFYSMYARMIGQDKLVHGEEDETITPVQPEQEIKLSSNGNGHHSPAGSHQSYYLEENPVTAQSPR